MDVTPVLPHCMLSHLHCPERTSRGIMLRPSRQDQEGITRKHVRNLEQRHCDMGRSSMHRLWIDFNTLCIYNSEIPVSTHGSKALTIAGGKDHIEQLEKSWKRQWKKISVLNSQQLAFDMVHKLGWSTGLVNGWYNISGMMHTTIHCSLCNVTTVIFPGHHRVYQQVYIHHIR